MAAGDLASIRLSVDRSIRRACACGLVAIGTLVLGLPWRTALPARMAALGVTLMTVLLLFKALRPAPPTPGSAAIGRPIRERLLWHATAAGWIAGALWLLVLATAG